jgi:hypothetical protein
MSHVNVNGNNDDNKGNNNNVDGFNNPILIAGTALAGHQFQHAITDTTAAEDSCSCYQNNSMCTLNGLTPLWNT